jgi:Flp pilus assembly protein TadD
MLIQQPPSKSIFLDIGYVSLQPPISVGPIFFPAAKIRSGTRVNKGGNMQNFPVAARAFPLLLIFFVTPAVPQSTARLQSSNVSETALNIEKVNKRPVAPAGVLILEYEKLLKAKPNDPVLLNNLGANYFLAGRVFESQSLLRKAVQRAPNLTQIRVNLAVVLNKTYNPGLAIEMLEGVLKQEPRFLRAREILCEIYEQEKKLTETISCFEVLEKSGGLKATAAANYGTALIEMKEIGRALSFLEQADLKFPDDAGIKNGLGVALFLKKKYKVAETHLRRAVELAPAAAQVRYNLAMAQVMTNNRGAVLEQYKFLKTSDPELANKLFKILFRDKVISANPQ